MLRNDTVPMNQGRCPSNLPQLNTRQRLGRASLVLAAGALAYAGPKALLALGDLPLCLFKHLTGLPCPLCGGTRAMSHLAELELLKALDANAGVVIAAGLLGLLGIATLAEALRGRTLFRETSRRRLLEAGAATAGLAMVVGWVPRLWG